MARLHDHRKVRVAVGSANVGFKACWLVYDSYTAESVSLLNAFAASTAFSLFYGRGGIISGFSSRYIFAAYTRSRQLQESII